MCLLGCVLCSLVVARGGALSEYFIGKFSFFTVTKCSVYLNRRVFFMNIVGIGRLYSVIVAHPKHLLFY